MLRLVTITAAVLIGAAAFAFADDWVEPEQSCDGNTREIVECLIARTKQWEKRMDTAFKQALADAGPKQRNKLVAAQGFWLKFREANCDYYDLGPGTYARIQTGYCMKDLTAARARELESATERH